MLYPTPLITATWIQRRKRFLLDIRIELTTEIANQTASQITTAHCPNTGSMLGINTPGSQCLLLPSNNPKRKLPYTLEAVRVGNIWVGAHPIRANTIGREAIEAGLIPEIGNITSIRTEVPYGTSSRADLLIETASGPPWFVEIKSASLAENNVSMFPDAVTSRGLKHLNELASVVRHHGRFLMLFVATRSDVDAFKPASSIDPTYAKRLYEVSQAGVLVRAITSEVSPTSMVPTGTIPVVLDNSLA